MTPVDAVSVNHAKVAPTSIARHRTMAMTLPSKARLVLLRFVISISSYFLRVGLLAGRLL